MGRKITDEYKRKTRTRHKTILVGVEGKKNKTENLYFNSFNVRGGNYVIKIANGNSTDPLKMVKDIIKTMRLKDIDVKYGDKIYCVFDSDEDENKDLQIKKAIALARKHNIEIIVSNPCFEEWFLCNFKYTTGDKVIEKLKCYIPNYDKNIDVFPIVDKFTEVGIKNAKKQIKYHKSLGRDVNLTQSNPCTNVYKIIEEIRDNMY